MKKMNNLEQNWGILILIYCFIVIIFGTKNEFYSYIVTGTVMLICFHVFENIGMTIGILPVTEIPLPFISYGGSKYDCDWFSIVHELSA